jgi:hypothetical protein
MNEQELKNQIDSLQREYLDLRTAISSLTGNLNNNAILRGTLSGAGVSAESILKCIIRIEKINIKSNDPKIPVERADELRKKEVQGLMLDEMIRLTESKLPLRIITHLRTIQAWRNIGSHDKGEQQINETVNSNTLQVVSLALSELVTWFVGEYLNQDATGFNFEESLSFEDDNTDPISEWSEEYWFAMRKGTLKVLDEAKLKKIQTQYNLGLSEIDSVKSNFHRQDQLFKQILEEAFEDNLIDIDELEAIEQSRNDCCISIKETKEILNEFNWKVKFKEDPNKLDVQWMKEELVSQNAISADSKNTDNFNAASSDSSLNTQPVKVDIKATVEKLKFLVMNSNSGIRAEKISIWKGFVLYFEYTLCNDYRIVVDTVLKDEGWEIHVNGRNTKSKYFLFETMCKTPRFLPMNIENYETGERLVFKELTPVKDIEIIKDSLIDLLQRIQNFEDLINWKQKT